MNATASTTEYYTNFAKAGAIAGIIVVIMYFLSKITALPEGLYYGLHVFQGPVMVFSWMGMYAFFRLQGASVVLTTAVVFGIVSAISRMMFLVVQLNNLIFIGEYKDAAAPGLRESWNNILKGVFTVQNGLNITSDIFLDLAIILFGAVCWSDRRMGKMFAVSAFVAGGLHLVFKAYTFPKPPATAGLFDAGPVAAMWPLFAAVWILRDLYRKKHTI
ncbi:MAG: hypothetical protein HUU02_16800 [Bacteroidetes bacterium]|nr:hypothetical protein [Bacteroidota bacterium]